MSFQTLLWVALHHAAYWSQLQLADSWPVVEGVAWQLHRLTSQFDLWSPAGYRRPSGGMQQVWAGAEGGGPPPACASTSIHPVQPAELWQGVSNKHTVPCVQSFAVQQANACTPVMYL